MVAAGPGFHSEMHMSDERQRSRLSPALPLTPQGWVPEQTARVAIKDLVDQSMATVIFLDDVKSQPNQNAPVAATGPIPVKGHSPWAWKTTDWNHHRALVPEET